MYHFAFSYGLYDIRSWRTVYVFGRWMAGILGKLGHILYSIGRVPLQSSKYS